ncbi:DUF2802 domain-containing protein [Simiduia curdlanivorans]|uniref:DUF2802 domain-containing protein n=1 Tax=Simiduia curdlanivorans TaxID=1492769 RepID=A0ABV8V7B3_9GAMM|nr:DUF2802 domain-containing protein [Simiduia curdlanivorans]MDN3639886.1 DUF2802 domain-containing protein [Simiduia curdlanivorans]
MEQLVTQFSSLEVILVGVVAMSWVAIALAMSSFAKVRRQEVLVRESLEDLRRAIHTSNSGLVGMGRKLLSIEKNVVIKGTNKKASKAVETPVPSLKYSLPKAESRYAQAANMVSQGLSVAQVAAATGMSQAEVNLLAMLQRPAIETVS